MKILLILASVLGLWFVPSWAYALTQPTDCTYAQVNAAVASAVTADPLEVVQIPGGTCTWTSTLIVGAKSIVIQGIMAGTVEQCNAQTPPYQYTCIKHGATPQAMLINWATITTGSPRITGITFESGNTGANALDATFGVLTINGHSGNFRLDHTNIYAHRGGESAFSTWGNLRGVLDHNIIDCTGPGGTTTCIEIQHPLWNGVTITCPIWTQSGGCGDSSWATPTGFGGPNWLFIEDNTITNRTTYLFCSDGWRGQRFVWRYNTMTNCSSQNHGTDTSGRYRGGRAQEIYGNACSATVDLVACHSIRGGAMLAWGNRATIPGCSYDTCRPVDVNHYRTTAGNQCSYWYCADNALKNRFDQGFGTSNGYAAMDQTGRGQGDLITGGTNGGPPPQWDSLTPYPVPTQWPNQALEPVYAWLNTLNGTNVPLKSSAGTNYVLENRDYYTERQTLGSNNFNGTTGTLGTTSGIGIGTKIEMQASPCVTGGTGTLAGGGQAWWVTNEGTWATGTDSTGVSHAGFDGQLYKCTATNTWTLYYTPYTYPHPLVTETPVEPPPPQPTGLRLISSSNTNHICLVWPPASVANLQGYHIYHGMTAGVYTDVFVVHATNSAAAHKPVTQYCYTSAIAGTHYFSMSAYDNLGVDTELATEVSATFTALSRTTAAARSAAP